MGLSPFLLLNSQRPNVQFTIHNHLQPNPTLQTRPAIAFSRPKHLKQEPRRKYSWIQVPTLKSDPLIMLKKRVGWRPSITLQAHELGIIFGFHILSYYHTIIQASVSSCIHVYSGIEDCRWIQVPTPKSNPLINKTNEKKQKRKRGG